MPEPPPSVGLAVRFSENVQLARAMVVARHPQVVGAANVDAELEGVVTPGPRHIADDLPLLLVLVERAVAAVDAEARSEIEAAGRR